MSSKGKSSKNRRRKTRGPWRDLIPCYLSIQDKDLRITEVNELFLKDFGDQIGEYCYKVYKDADAPCDDCPILLTFEDGKVHTAEKTVVMRNNEIADVVVTSAPVLDDDGEVVEVVEMFTNVTEINTLKKEVAVSRRKYKQLFNAVPCYICVLNDNLEIVESNAYYRKDFDVSLGSHCYEVCKNRNAKCQQCLVEQTFADGQVHSSEEKLTTRHGKELNLIVYSMPIPDESGKIETVMEVFTDITAVKQLQRRLTLMGRAVAGMAHRIKNIMMGLEGSIFVVNTGNEMENPELIDEGWEMVERNVARVSRLVADLLYCSKERVPEFKDDVAPGTIVREVSELYQKRLKDEGITLQLEVADPEQRGKLDPDALNNMMNNLTANAIDACRFDQDGKKTAHTITLRYYVNKENAHVFEVEDDGAGIPEEVGDKVFEDFFSTKGAEGTGVGLLVVQKVAEEHGGTVTFNTKVGRGTTFRVTIPG